METNTVEYNKSLPKEKQLEILKEAKPGTWYDGWKPYCLKCSTYNRMIEMPYGFRCVACCNMIGFDLCRLKESTVAENIDYIVIKPNGSREIIYKKDKNENTSNN